ncbi:16S rRNA (uracil(1498)-N(3))-methyltransferase [Kushneria phosphatilytica]|uniref:Ribosomal RNA small subunit methyltransferase E n=1 Tax=Kushneria phosphatilytica TaxID=657387 RepID=A0A1S1NXV8_9GAMM|nr:16S rRNA (uracil(1498)-N(3))-methyltransferase [Kushneria phosphatilytica]OHV12727.1 16S rRNA (uracil(1498)-N(3))-methyltransferase [Kushneria phosphatilytica]QEL10568.1 16S rRNA (uracil(1498)-N(3))-methyltransferase [Kushneria phosphatilytica]
MNLLLLKPEEQYSPNTARVTDPRRLRHLHDVHRARQGDTLMVGVEEGGIGRAIITELSSDAVELTFDALDQTPPAALPVHVLLALPRPRMLARTLENIAALGVKELTLLHTARVEKSFWQSPELSVSRIHDHLILGLEQARDTRLPRIHMAPRFRPFVEDTLPNLIENRRALLAHPGQSSACPRQLPLDSPVTLAIGPEGGFVDYEVERLLAAGFEGIHLGERILRVETAVVALLARLF